MDNGEDDINVHVNDTIKPLLLFRLGYIPHTDSNTVKPTGPSMEPDSAGALGDITHKSILYECSSVTNQDT